MSSHNRRILPPPMDDQGQVIDDNVADGCKGKITTYKYLKTCIAETIRRRNTLLSKADAFERFRTHPETLSPIQQNDIYNRINQTSVYNSCVNGQALIFREILGHLENGVQVLAAQVPAAQIPAAQIPAAQVPQYDDPATIQARNQRLRAIEVLQQQRNMEQAQARAQPAAASDLTWYEQFEQKLQQLHNVKNAIIAKNTNTTAFNNDVLTGLQAINTKLTRLKSAVAKLVEDVNACEDNLVQATTKGVDVDNNLKELREQLTREIAEKTQLRDTISIHEATIRELENQIIQIEAEKTNLIRQYTQENTALKEQIAGLNEEQIRCSNFITSLRATIDEQTAEIANLQQDIQRLRQQFVRQQGTSDECAEQVGELTRNIDAMKRLLQTANEVISSVIQELRDAPSHEASQGQITALLNQITNEIEAITNTASGRKRRVIPASAAAAARQRDEDEDGDHQDKRVTRMVRDQELDVHMADNIEGGGHHFKKRHITRGKKHISRKRRRSKKRGRQRGGYTYDRDGKRPPISTQLSKAIKHTS